MSDNNQYVPGSFMDTQGYNAGHKSLTGAVPDTPTKTSTSTDDMTNVKIATSNLFMSNQPDIQTEEIVRQLFSNISAKELIGITSTNAVSTYYQVPSYNNNITNNFEISQSYNSLNMLSLIIPVNKDSNIVNQTTSSISGIQATVTVPSVSSSIKGQVQNISVATIQLGTKYP